MTPTPILQRGHYMRTFTGRKVWPLDLRPEDICIEDIAHALSRQCRYNGHCHAFLSVAEHSVWCSFYGPEDEALERLMHDAAEAYVGDLIRPLKMIPEIHAIFKPIEERADEVIFSAFGLRFPFPASVKKADEAVCEAEMRQHMKDHDHSSTLHDSSVAAPYTIEGWEPALARKRFMQRFRHLMAQRGLREAA